MAHEGIELEVDEELIEFLEADLLPEAAHPVFKTQLREYLRAMLRAEGRLRPQGSQGPEDGGSD